MLVTPLYLAIFAVMLCGLFLNVVRNRFKHSVALGDKSIPELQRARVIHGNFVETVPFIILLMWVLESSNSSIYVIHALGILMIISRLLHIHGIYAPNALGVGRVAGGILFNILLLSGAILIFLKYLNV